jgi:signal transduction histidine kinase/CheY-like chemotaxis protein
MPMPEILNVLLIEGQGGVARSLLSGRTGMTVTWVERMADAASSAIRASSGFSALLIDSFLPDAEGLDAYRRAAVLMPGVPVVVLHSDGDGAFAEAVLSEGAQACLDKQGLDYKALAQALRQAVHRGRAEARRFRALFDSAPVGILIAAGRRVLSANPAAMELIGRGESDFARHSILEFFPEACRPMLEKALDAGAGTVPEARFTAGLIRPEGDSVDCRVFVTRTMLNEAPAVALYLAPLDAADRADGALPHRARKMQALGRLSAGVAHDFNNLLTTINGYSEHLQTLPGADGGIASGLKAIRKAGEAAAGISRNLMAFSHGGGGDMRPVKVDDAVREAVPSLRSLLGERVELVVKAGAGDACARLEAGGLETMLIRLCENACEAMGGAGVLTVCTETAEEGHSEAFTHLAPGRGPHIVLSVEDTGGGMDPETLERLFEPFHSAKRGGRGSGLGLAGVYGVVSRAGGGISVTSNPGQGSRFRIFLGMLPSGQAIQAPSAGPAWAARKNRETVLVVEDDANLREMVVAVLSRYGFAVLESPSAEEALAGVEDRPESVDLVVTDVMLRGESGHEMAAALQALKPGLRTVFISGYSLDSLAERGILVPADAFLEKPFSPAQLAAKVRAVLDTARKA